MKPILLIASGAAMLSTNAFAGDANSDFKMFLMKMMPKVVHAFEHKDLNFFKSISTPDFTEKMGGKTMTAQESMAEMKQGFAMTSSMKCSFKLLSSKVMGNTGVAMTYGHMTMMMKPMKKGDKTHKMVTDMWEKETWVRMGKSWKIKMLEEAKPMKMWMDGKPTDPSKMMGGG